VDKSGYTRAVDWWAVGVVLYEMLTGRLPFSYPAQHGSSKNQRDYRTLFNKILTDEPHLLLSELSAEACSLLAQLLEKQAHRRLGASPADLEDVKRHAFFASIPTDDWSRLADTDAPFIPTVQCDVDTSNFCAEFTSQSVHLTPPPPQPILRPQQQQQQQQQKVDSWSLCSNRFSNYYFDAYSFYGSSSSGGSIDSRSSLRQGLLATHTPTARPQDICDFSFHSNTIKDCYESGSGSRPGLVCLMAASEHLSTTQLYSVSRANHVSSSDCMFKQALLSNSNSSSENIVCQSAKKTMQGVDLNKEFEDFRLAANAFPNFIRFEAHEQNNGSGVFSQAVESGEQLSRFNDRLVLTDHGRSFSPPLFNWSHKLSATTSDDFAMDDQTR
jgi:serine/threonine protein kinase